jgi:hypothetical protein
MRFITYFLFGLTVATNALAQTSPMPGAETSAVASPASPETSPPAASAPPPAASTGAPPPPITLEPPALPPPNDGPGGARPPGAYYYYYCQKLGAYYPSVKSCPDAWIAVPMENQTQDYWYHWQPLGYHHSIEMDNSRPNSINLELFGRAELFSFNFDRALTDHLTLGIGISSWRESDWWQNYSATIVVVPVYANYYFTKKSRRGYLTGGADFISASSPGPNSNLYDHNGTAATIGGGYEQRETNGFLFRIGGVAVFGRTSALNPSVVIGYSF